MENNLCEGKLKNSRSSKAYLHTHKPHDLTLNLISFRNAVRSDLISECIDCEEENKSCEKY